MTHKLFDVSRIPRTKAQLASMIDHTVLKPTESFERILEAIEETEKNSFRALVIPHWSVRDARGVTKARLATVISFPHGTDPVEIKRIQAEKAIGDGADEIDVVINLMAVKSGRKDIVEEEAKRIIQTAHERGVKVKYIIEIGALTLEETLWVVEKLLENKVDYVKTCTGYGPRGVNIDDVILLKSIIGGKAGIKASGGIRRGLQALMLIGYGADVLGTSSSIKILDTYENAMKILGL